MDIEFLVQMLQLKYGSKYKDIRVQNTADTLDALKRNGLIKKKEYEVLKGGLFFLKKMENLLRLLHDRSINELYEGDFEKLATEMNVGSGQRLKEEYITKTDEIRDIYDKYFL